MRLDLIYLVPFLKRCTVIFLCIKNVTILLFAFDTKSECVIVNKLICGGLLNVTTAWRRHRYLGPISYNGLQFESLVFVGPYISSLFLEVHTSVTHITHRVTLCQTSKPPAYPLCNLMKQVRHPGSLSQYQMNREPGFSKR